MVIKNIKIGILALHGSFVEHMSVLEKLGACVCEVRQKKDLDGISGLVIPGGESTTMSLLLKNKELKNEIIRLIKNGLPVFGTCAGAILLSKTLSLMDIELERNAYGSQLDSFEEEVILKFGDGGKKFYAIFIRAPKILKVGEGVEVLARNSAGDIILAKENNILVATFHPELTPDETVHEYFLKMCEK
jgi:5'-phosphate synthase pdxT subunit